MNKLTIVNADDWEGLFVNGKLVDEGHELGRGDGSRHVIEYAKRMLEQYSPCELEFKNVTDEYYDEYLSQYGSFPSNLEEVEVEVEVE